MKVGIIGYSNQSFNKQKAREEIKRIYDELEDKHNNISIVSGYTNLGIPKIAYEEATEKGWETVGIACKKASNYETYPVDKFVIVGEDWGDESELFLNSIDILVKIGGGKQSDEECRKAKEKNIIIYENIEHI